MKPPSTPCVKICVLDSNSGLCIGCGRTGDEIASWPYLPELKRLAIMEGLRARLAAVRSRDMCDGKVAARGEN